MRVHSTASRLLPASLCCLGTFDGMHRGHQALAAACMRPGHPSAIATFLDHPARVLAPGKAPPRLQTKAQRERVCRALGLDQFVYLPFDREVAAMSPQEFATQFLVETLAPQGVVVGDDFRFGAKRAGDAALLGQLLAPFGIEVTVLDTQRLGAAQDAPRLSSTLARQCIQTGQLQRCCQILGRPYALCAPIVAGAGRGRALQIPTANMHPSQCLPPLGVYAGWAGIPDQPELGLLPAVANLGHHPTFGATKEPQLEVHVLTEPALEIYGLELEFHLIEHLRDEQTFDSATALQAAIAQDIARAKTLLTPASKASITIAALR